MGACEKPLKNWLIYIIYYMKTIKLYVMAVLAISLAACSGGGKLTPTSKKVNGPLGKFFEVVERDYKMSENELSVEFKRILKAVPQVLHGLQNRHLR
jgi:hypothetical protein